MIDTLLKSTATKQNKKLALEYKDAGFYRYGLTVWINDQETECKAVISKNYHGDWILKLKRNDTYDTVCDSITAKQLFGYVLMSEFKQLLTELAEGKKTLRVHNRNVSFTTFHAE